MTDFRITRIVRFQKLLREFHETAQGGTCALCSHAVMQLTRATERTALVEIVTTLNDRGLTFSVMRYREYRAI